jgi:glutathione S-transferase
MITLWGRRNSINVQKVLWTLDELGLAFEHVDAGGDAGGLDEPAFRAMNPHGRVPVLRDGDVAAIWESHTIVRYLCAAYSPGGLCPTTPLERAGADAWMDWTLATLQPAIMGLFWGFYRTPAAQRDAARNRDCAAQAATAIRALDEWLGERPFVAGVSFSMADIPAGTLMHRYFGMEIVRPRVAHVDAWRARLQARSAYKTHVMTPFAELFGRLAF